MRRWMIVAALLLCLPVWSEGQEFIRYYPPAGLTALTSSGTAITSTLPILGPNGAVGAASFAFASDPDTGLFRSSDNQLGLSAGGVFRWYFSVNGLIPAAGDSYRIGGLGEEVSSLYITRSFQGSKSKALTEASATSFVRVAVAQTAAGNYAGGSVGYTVYATDGTDSQSLVGDVRFGAVNKAGAETCVIGEVGTPVLGASSGTLTCTFTCATAAADTVDLSANCTSSLVQTTFTIEHRGNMQKINTYTPQ